MKKEFYNKPKACTYYMTSVRFVGTVKPKSCHLWGYDCLKLTEVKNSQNIRNIKENRTN